MSSRLGARPASAPISGPPEKAKATSTNDAHGDTPPVARANASSTSEAGATSERRRLSSIFQRLIARRRQRLAWQQERQQLPVAARPAVHARGGDVGVERRVLDDRDVGDRGAARHRAFEQVVAQDAVLGQAAAEHGVHRLHVEQALAGVGAFAEDVLVDLRARRAVRVDSRLAGEQPVVERDLARARAAASRRAAAGSRSRARRACRRPRAAAGCADARRRRRARAAAPAAGGCRCRA